MKRKKRNKFRKKIRAVKLTIFLVIVMILGGTGSILAKYYSFEFRKGVAVASDIYFESDVLQSIQFSTASADNTSTDNASVDTALNPDFSSFVPYVRSGGWSTTGKDTVTVTFHILNYKSKLQYNQNLDIVYDVYAMVATGNPADSSITYQLLYGDATTSTTTTTEITTEAAKIFEGVTLPGATEDTKLQQNAFTLTINPNGQTEIPKEVYIWAVPTEPTYLAGNDHALALGAKIQFTVMQQQFSVTGSLDVLTKLKESGESETLSDEEKSAVKKQSAFTYTISTTGEYTGTKTDDSHLNQVPVELSWNSNYIELDKFSKFRTSTYKGSDIVTDENNISTMTIWLDAYSESDIVFYRVNKNSTSLEDLTYGELKNLVTFSVLGETEVVSDTQTQTQ